MTIDADTGEDAESRKSAVEQFYDTSKVQSLELDDIHRHSNLPFILGSSRDKMFGRRVLKLLYESHFQITQGFAANPYLLPAAVRMIDL